MNKKILLMLVLTAIMLPLAWAKTPKTITFIRETYTRNEEPENLSSDTKYYSFKSSTTDKKITVTAFTPAQSNEFIEKSARWDLTRCEERGKKNDKISCELIKCGDNDWLLSEILSFDGKPIMLTFQRYVPQGRIRHLDMLDDGELKATLDEYHNTFCKLKVF